MMHLAFLVFFEAFTLHTQALLQNFSFLSNSNVEKSSLCIFKCLLAKIVPQKSILDGFIIFFVIVVYFWSISASYLNASANFQFLVNLNVSKSLSFLFSSILVKKLANEHIFDEYCLFSLFFEYFGYLLGHFCEPSFF